MAIVYRYTDINDEKIKYVGIVWSGNRTLKQRDEEHRANDEWCKCGKWRVEYLKKEVNNRTDAEALESHYISKFGTDQFFNTRKAGWGTSEIINDSDDEWALYRTDEEQVTERFGYSDIDETIRTYNSGNGLAEYVGIFFEKFKAFLPIETVKIGHSLGVVGLNNVLGDVHWAIHISAIKEYLAKIWFTNSSEGRSWTAEDKFDIKSVYEWISMNCKVLYEISEVNGELEWITLTDFSMPFNLSFHCYRGKDNCYFADKVKITINSSPVDEETMEFMDEFITPEETNIKKLTEWLTEHCIDKAENDTQETINNNSTTTQTEK